MTDPVYLPQVSRSTSPKPRLSPQTDVAQATFRAGQQIEQTSANLLDRELSLMSQSYVSEFYGRAAERFEKSKAEYDESGVGFSQNYMSNFDEDFNSYIEERGVNPFIAGRLRREIAPVRKQFTDRSISYENDARSEFRKRSLTSSFASVSNAALTDPDSYVEQKERLDSLLESARPFLSPAEYTRMVEQGNKSLDESTLQGLVNNDPIRAKAEIEAGLWSTVDPGILRSAFQKAENKENQERVASLVAAASSDPIQFYRQARTGSFSDPYLAESWNSISESDKLDIATKSISLANQMNNYEDSLRARRDRAIGDASDDLRRQFYMAEDPMTKQNLLDRMAILGHESGETLQALQNNLQSTIMESGRDDPFVYDNILNRFVSGNYNVEPMDFIGTGLSRSTAVDLSLKFRTARDQTNSEALSFLRNAVKLNTEWGRLGQREADREEAQLTMEFLDRVSEDRTQSPMGIARKMAETYDIEKTIQTTRRNLERAVIDSLSGVPSERNRHGVMANEDIPRAEDGTIDTQELINRMNYYMMEGIIDRESFVDGPARAIRDLHNFQKGLTDAR